MQTQKCTVTVNVGDVELRQEYEQVIRNSVKVDDLLTLLSDPKTSQDVIDNWHYGMDLKAKAETKRKIETNPENVKLVSVEKSVRSFMQAREKMGKPISYEKAKAALEAME